jgi:predicted O-linked N-acetylglucosamine transferase (SPINDLY family)
MSHLLVNLFELHDKSTFEIFGFSFGPEKNDEIRLRISNAFDKFINVKFKSDSEIVRFSRDLNIDIAIDLMCFSQFNRFGIFVEKCAPIQINFLGYPGTSGSKCIDYILADKIIIPEKFKKYYSEKIIYMPDSYKLDHPTRKISDKIFTREELGLPKNGFVFCCFNQTYKITPNVFGIWMKILKQVKGSVLWLLEDNLTATNNLKLEANKRDIDVKRIIFARRMKMSDHLARLKVADLFIDTLPYNAHTSASDGLWVGLPFLTLAGDTFASRVGASMLNAIGLPELITHSENEYKNKAIELATNSTLLKEIKKKLERNKLSKPLFDAKLFTKNVESAYIIMHEKYHLDKPTNDIYIK